MALYYVLYSLLENSMKNGKIRKFSWKIRCRGAFCFAKTTQLIHGASEVSGFSMVWVFTVKRIFEQTIRLSLIALHQFSFSTHMPKFLLKIYLY